MPLLAGGRIGNAGGDNLLDASSNNLGEAGIVVAVGGNGVLYDVNQNAGGIDLSGIEDILDLVTDLAATIAGIVDGTILMSQMTALDSHLTAVEGDVEDIHIDLGTLTSSNTNSIQDVLDAIALIAPGGLTTEEHDALLALENADYDQIASAVWGYTMVLPDMLLYDEGPMAQTVVQNMAYFQTFLAGYVGLPVPDRAHFNYCAKSLWTTTQWLGYWTNEASTTAVPELDLSLVVSGDTVWDYLQREYPGYTWLHAGPGDWPIGNRIYLDGGAGQAWYVCTLTDSDIRNWWPPESDPPPTVNVEVDVPPVWPGVADVTLGTPVALVDQLHLVGDLDGIIIAITTPPTRTGLRQIGGALYDYGVGEVAFETDSGDIEPWQYLGFRAAIFTPKTMKQAAGARFRVLAGAAGTVTPWTRS